jgi:hypothetical protein
VTFNEAIQVWRDEIIADSDTSRWQDTDGLAYLTRSAQQIADAFELMKATKATDTLTAGDVSFAAPTGTLRIDSYGLSINGIRLDPASYDTVIQKQMLGQVKYPRYYHYDPALDNLIRFGPAINADVAAGGVVVKYTSTYDTSAFDGSEAIWGGAWPGFHYLVLYRSGIMSFNSLELYGRSNYFAQIYNEELKNFAAALGRTDLANLLVPANQRDDTNRVRA